MLKFTLFAVAVVFAIAACWTDCWYWVGPCGMCLSILGLMEDSAPVSTDFPDDVIFEAEDVQYEYDFIRLTDDTRNRDILNSYLAKGWEFHREIVLCSVCLVVMRRELVTLEAEVVE